MFFLFPDTASDRSKKRPADFPGSLRAVADESERRRAGVRAPRRETPPRGRSLPVCEGALCARARPTEQGSGVSPFKLPPHARLHVYTIGAAQRRSKVPHSEGVEPPAGNDASGSKVPTPIA